MYDFLKNDTGLRAAKILFKVKCLGTEFSIMRFISSGKRRYSVHQEGTELYFLKDDLKSAYLALYERMHLFYNLNIEECKNGEKQNTAAITRL